MNKIIFHVDVNSAFLSWSAVNILRENPDAVDLRTIPSAVGGDVSSRHGIITAKSIPAKKYGIVTGEPVVKALEKCPSLVLVKGDFTLYRECSAAFIDILREYGSVVEQVSIDEAFVDMTQMCNCIRLESDNIEIADTAFREVCVSIATTLKNEVRERLGFTVNVGISVNKLLAKMASDFEKPDKVHTLMPDEISNKMWPLPIGELFGCGKSTAAALKNVGIRTIGDAAAMDMSILQGVLGNKAGEYIWRSANGYGSDEVSDDVEQAKSYSNETTLPFDIDASNYSDKMPDITERLAASVSRRMKRDGVFGNVVKVLIKTNEFKRHSKQITIDEPTNDEEVIRTIGARLLDELLMEDEDAILKMGKAIRLVGVGCAGIDDGKYSQTSLFAWADNKAAIEEKSANDAARREKTDKINAAIRILKEKYGDDVIQHASQNE